jgi:iron complex outermembrane receptor protein
MDGQVGEVLEGLPGVSATGFSPGASRPVLRGFQGERVKVLVDGIGAIDVSNTSADHAVSIDPLTAQRIEVLRGPAVLLFGSQAIGGAVNIIDKRIPRRIPDEPVHIDATGALDTAFNRREIGASVDTALGSNFAFHVDGSYRKTDDFEIPGFVASETLRADLLADAAEEEEEGHEDEAAELREAATLSGFVPNSATETYTAGAGLSYIGSGASLGFSVGYYDTAYGVPTRPGFAHAHGEEEHGDGHDDDHGDEDHDHDHDHEHEGHEEGHGEENVSIGLQQWRADVRGEVELGGFFESARLRAGYSDYTHTEFEGDEVGTVFDVEGVEARLELVQRRSDGWGGSIGAQYYHRDFAAQGAEAYVAPNTTDQFAIFAVQEVDLGSIGLEGAARYERSEVASPSVAMDRGYDSFSGAIGISNDPDANLRVGLNASRAERAPSAEELLSNGPHIATQQFEVGDTNLSTEVAYGLEGYVAGRAGAVQANLAVYNLWFDDFIYLSATGAEEDGLPVYAYLQDEATWFGVEGELRAPLVANGPFEITGEIGGDYIRARLDDGTAVPRIPPMSLYGALEADHGDWGARVEVRHNFAPDELAPLETPTDAFTMVDASLSWRPLRGADNLTVMLQAENLFDVEGRRHASFTKDFVPLAGRNVKLSARLSL